MGGLAPDCRCLVEAAVGAPPHLSGILGEVAEWLSGAGVTLFFAGSTYAAVKTSVVESWPRVTSKRIDADVRAVAQGTFDFSRLEHLMAVLGQDVGEDE